MKLIPMLQFVLSAIVAVSTVSLTVQCATGNASEMSTILEAAPRDMTERNLVIKKSFTAVEVSTGVKLFYTVGTSNKVRIIGPEDQVEHTVVTVDGSALKISINNESFSKSSWGKNVNVSVYVTAPVFNAIKANSGSIITIETEMSVSGDYTVRLSSGAIFNANMGLKCGTLKVDNSSGSIAKINGIKATNANVDLSSGSILTMSGTVASLDVDVSSGAIANLEGLQANKGRVDASSGAIVNIRKGSLSVDSSSGAIIHQK